MNLALFLLLCLQGAAPQLRTNFWVKRFDRCNKTTPTVFNGNVTNENGKQYIDFNITMKWPLDEKIGSRNVIEYGVDGKTFVPLFIIQERYLCKAASTYLGEYFYDLERAAQIPTGLCPIRAGRYQIHHHYLDFKRISLQTFPFGWLRFTLEAIENKSSRCLFCVLIEVENVLN